jgi:hypothetical protein
VTTALARVAALARDGRLYPAVILHGASAAARAAAAIEIARTLLCERDDPAARPCDDCRHCRRIVAPDGEGSPFHPDFAWLARDAKTVTSTEATRELLRAAHSAPFEARGQVFVVAEADTLSAEAGDLLLKILEEPGLGAPRHFLLLAPSRLDLAETLRSRSLAVFLGPAEPPETGRVEAIATAVVASLARRAGQGGGIWLLDVAARLGEAGDFTDARAERPWSTAAAAASRAALDAALPPDRRGALLALAESLLAAAPMRLRGIPPERILEGLAARHLA